MGLGQGGIQRLPITGLSAGDNTVIPAVAGARAVLTHYQFTATQATNLIFKSGDGTALTGTMAVAVPGIGAANNDKGHVVSKVGQGLIINISATGLEGYISFFYD